MLFWNETSGTPVQVEAGEVEAVVQAANGTLIELGEAARFGYKITSRDWLALLFMTLGNVFPLCSPP